MRRLGIALFACLVVFSASAAWAQYGLYGSPDVLPVGQQNAQASYAAPAQPQYSYPATSQTTYQPYQPGAQHQYPAPAAQPVAWTAPAEQPALMQPIPQPPAPAGSPTVVPAPQGFATPQPGYSAPPQSSGMMNQMLAEQGSVCAGGCNGTATCGQEVLCGRESCSLWYGSFSALVLSRLEGRRLWTSSELFPNEAHQLGNSDVPLAWKWGGEVQLGRRFCCACTPYALEATFWTTEAFTGSETTTLNPVRIGTPLLTDNVNFNVPNYTIPATSIFVNALTSTVSRRDEFYDFEINLIREQLVWACDSPWEIGWSVGVRYFRFQESLSVGAINPDVVPGGAEAFFSDTVTNNMVGPQVGFDIAYNVGGNVRLFIHPQVGIYGNCVDSNFQARGRLTSGSYVDGTNTILGYPNFPAHGTSTGVAFLTQIDVGADWRFTRNWGARLGYRVVAITGAGLADDEFPQSLCDTPEMQNPQHSSSLVLHGAFAGLTYNF